MTIFHFNRCQRCRDGDTDESHVRAGIRAAYRAGSLSTVGCVFLIFAVVVCFGTASAQKWQTVPSQGRAEAKASNQPTYARNKAAEKALDNKVKDAQDLLKQLGARIKEYSELKKERGETEGRLRFKRTGVWTKFVPTIRGVLQEVYIPKFWDTYHVETQILKYGPDKVPVVLRHFGSPKTYDLKERPIERWELIELRAACESLVDFARSSQAQIQSGEAVRFDQYWIALTRYGREETVWGPTANATGSASQIVFVFRRKDGCDGAYTILGTSDA